MFESLFMKRDDIVTQAVNVWYYVGKLILLTLGVRGAMQKN